MYKIIAEYFVKWAHAVFNYEVNEDDKRKISENRTGLLGHETRLHYDRFSDNILPIYMELWGLSIKKSYEKLKQLGLQ